MAMPQCCYLAKGAKRPSHTTKTIKFDRIPFDPCNSIKRFDLCPFDQKNSISLQPPLITQGLNPFYAVRIFDSYVKPRVTYCMTKWFHQNMTSLDKMWWSVHKSIFGIRNYQVSKHVVSVLSNIWPPSLFYTNQVLMFLHSTARSADILNPGNLAIIPHQVNGHLA